MVLQFPFAKPYIGDIEAQEVARVLATGWISQGPETAKFEEEWAAYTGADHAIAVSNCTAAMHLSLVAMGVGENDEVIVPSHSFIATANAIRMTGAVPVFVDIDPSTFNIDPELIEAAITPKTSAIMPVHQVGMPAELLPIRDLATKHSLKIIEDAACASGSEIQIDGSWQKIGNPIGDIACFSFHPRKILSTGEGGMITTNDADLAQKLRKLRQHSMSVPDTARHSSKNVIFESYDELGYNYRMSDILAAVGRVQLSKLDVMVKRRREIATLYGRLLAPIEGVAAPSEPEWAKSNWQSYCVLLDTTVDQQAVMQSLLEMGIPTRRGVMNAHLEKPYENYNVSLPISESVQSHGILLPMFHELTDDQLNTVVTSLEQVLAETVG
jgi:perosamine synthetase